MSDSREKCEGRGEGAREGAVSCEVFSVSRLNTIVEEKSCIVQHNTDCLSRGKDA